MGDSTKMMKIVNGLNVFKNWKLPNLIVLAGFLIAVTSIICFSGVTRPDADRIDTLNLKIEAMDATIQTLNATIRTLNARLESYEKILDYRIENIESKLGIKYKEDNHYEKEK